MNNMNMPKIGILLPTRGILLDEESHIDETLLFSMASIAEEANLNSVWVGDSLLAKPRLEPLSTLSALATSTKQVMLGTAVLLAPLRQPAQLAQMAATVDILSKGRLILGLGVGGVFNEAQQREWLAAGVDPIRRGIRMTELMKVCRLLWSQETVNFHGDFYHLENASLGLKPIRPMGIPMVLACHYATGSSAQYRRASNLADGVMGISDSPHLFSQVLKKIKSINSSKKLNTIFYMTININEDPNIAFEESDKFIKGYYGQNYWGDKWGPFGQPDDIANRILEYSKAGAEEIIIRFASVNNQKLQLQALIEKVLPTLYKKINDN